MAATKSSHSKKNYYSINNGHFTQPANENEGVQRKIEKKDGSTKIVWEHQFDEVSGIIKSVEIQDTDWGDQYQITISDIGEEFILQINCDSKYGNDFAAKFPNIKLNNQITFKPYSFTPEDKKRKMEGFVITQNGMKILQYYTKENPNGLPSLEKYQDAGVMSNPPSTADWKMFFAKRSEFMMNKVKDIIKNAPQQEPPQKQEVTPKQEDNDFDALPF
jgi:hypothetical protein